ncbi:chitinase [Saccharothrix sp. CB00851]|nr:chitinase [Saccharothrix sp. CB00851]
MVKLARSTALAVMAAVTLLVGSIAPTSAVARPAKEGPITTVYVEVNNNPEVREVGRYRLAKSGANVFDIAIIFAANIKADPDNKPRLSFNENLQSVLQNAETQIRPLQRRGIKVLLSVIGDHDGIGVANLQSQEEAAAFAEQLADVVAEYGLDGIDFDDEWADYEKGNPVNEYSFPYLVSALRDHLPDKLITLYFYGPATTTLRYGDIDLAKVFDYSWNSQYGTWDVPDIALPEQRLAPAAVNFTATPADDAAALARQTVSEGYGAYLTYNLPRSNVRPYVSEFTRELYGSDAIYWGNKRVG